jgi:hypothetical protein
MKADSLWTPRGRSGPHANNLTPQDRRSNKLPTTKPQHLGRSTRELARTGRTRDKHELSDGPRATGAQSVGPELNSPSTETRRRPSLSLHGSPKRLELLRKDLGSCKVSIGEAMPQNLSLKRTKSLGIESPPSSTKKLGSNRNPSTGGLIWRLRGHDQAQRCTRQLSIIPYIKSEPKHLRIKGTSHTRKSNKKISKKT